MRTAADALGLELFSTSHAAAVTAVKAPAGISSSDLVKGFKNEFGGVLSDGQGEMKGQILRIAHIGYLDYLDCIGVIAGLEQVLFHLGPERFQLGDGLRAAQLVYAEASRNGGGQ
jgi:aspartate aminotransferase-like enzyme